MDDKELDLKINQDIAGLVIELQTIANLVASTLDRLMVKYDTNAEEVFSKPEILKLMYRDLLLMGYSKEILYFALEPEEMAALEAAEGVPYPHVWKENLDRIEAQAKEFSKANAEEETPFTFEITTDTQEEN